MKLIVSINGIIDLTLIFFLVDNAPLIKNVFLITATEEYAKDVSRGKLVRVLQTVHKAFGVT